MAIIDSQVHLYEANTPQRPWRSAAPGWPPHVTGEEMVAAMDKLSRVGEQPSPADGLLPALLFDPTYRTVVEDLRVVAHNLREVSDRVAGGRHAGSERHVGPVVDQAAGVEHQAGPGIP